MPGTTAPCVFVVEATTENRIDLERARRMVSHVRHAREHYLALRGEQAATS